MNFFLRQRSQINPISLQAPSKELNIIKYFRSFNGITNISMSGPEEQIGLVESIEGIMHKQFNDYVKIICDFIKNLFNQFIHNKTNESSEGRPQKNPLPKLRITKAIQSDETVNSMCFLADGRLVTASDRVEIYKLKSYELDAVISRPHTTGVLTVFGLRNGNLASAGSYGGIRIWTIKGKKAKCVHTLEGHRDYIYKVIEMEDGKLCSCSKDGTIKIWDNNYECIQTLKGHTDSVISVIEVNNYIISSGNKVDDTVRIWDKSTYECVETLKKVCCFSGNGMSKLKDSAAIIAVKGKVLIIDVLSFQIQSFAHESLGSVFSICVLKNSNLLIGNDEGKIICFDLLSHQIMFTTTPHKETIKCIIESEDNQVFSSSEDKIINVYEEDF